MSNRIITSCEQCAKFCLLEGASNDKPPKYHCLLTRTIITGIWDLETKEWLLNIPESCPLTRRSADV